VWEGKTKASVGEKSEKGERDRGTEGKYETENQDDFYLPAYLPPTQHGSISGSISGFLSLSLDSPFSFLFLFVPIHTERRECRLAYLGPCDDPPSSLLWWEVTGKRQLGSKKLKNEKNK
jgi:hypothetical protein